MLQIEIISSFDEDDLVEKVNYFLSKIDECLVKEIKYSSIFVIDKINFSVMIVYLSR